MNALKFGDDSYYLVGDDKRLVFQECQLCHRQAAFFTNTGVTHCLGCEEAARREVEQSLSRAVVDSPAKGGAR